MFFGLRFGFNFGKVAPSNVKATFTPNVVNQNTGVATTVTGVLTAGKFPITITGITVSPSWAVVKPAITFPLAIAAGATSPISLELKPLAVNSGLGLIKVIVAGTANGLPFTQTNNIGYTIKDASKTHIYNRSNTIVNNGKLVLN